MAIYNIEYINETYYDIPSSVQIKIGNSYKTLKVIDDSDDKNKHKASVNISELEYNGNNQSDKFIKSFDEYFKKNFKGKYNGNNPMNYVNPLYIYIDSMGFVYIIFECDFVNSNDGLKVRVSEYGVTIYKAYDI